MITKGNRKRLQKFRAKVECLDLEVKEYFLTEVVVTEALAI